MGVFITSGGGHIVIVVSNVLYPVVWTAQQLNVKHMRYLG